MILTAAEMVSVDSTLLTSVAYEVGESLLQLGFRDGAIYLYFDVPETIYQGLLAAQSKGSYFNSQVRSRFRYTCFRRPT